MKLNIDTRNNYNNFGADSDIANICHVFIIFDDVPS